jgi:hypothetical protein
MVKAGDLVQAIGAQAEQTNTVALGDILAGMHISVLELYHLCGFNPSLLQRDIELVWLLEEGIPERECHVPCGLDLHDADCNMLSFAVPAGTLLTSTKHYRARQSLLDCRLDNTCTLCGARFVPGESHDCSFLAVLPGFAPRMHQWHRVNVRHAARFQTLDDPLFLSMFEARARSSGGNVVVLQDEDMPYVPVENTFAACKTSDGNWYVNTSDDTGILCRVGYRLLSSSMAQDYTHPTLSVQTCARENVSQAIHMTLSILAVVLPLPFRDADISNELMRLVRDDKMDLFAWREAVGLIVQAFVPATDDAVGCDEADAKRVRFFIENIVREGMFFGCSGVTNLDLTEQREGYLRLPQCQEFFCFALQHKVESDFWCVVPEMVEFRDGFVAHLVRVFGDLQTDGALSSLQDVVARSQTAETDKTERRQFRHWHATCVQSFPVFFEMKTAGAKESTKPSIYSLQCLQSLFYKLGVCKEVEIAPAKMLPCVGKRTLLRHVHSNFVRYMIVSEKWGEIEGERQVDELEECIQKRKRLATELQEQLSRLHAKNSKHH